MIRKTYRTLATATALAAVASASTPASALVIELRDTGGVGVGTNAFAGFTAAARFWEKVLTNNVTVKLNVNFSTLGSNILGSTGSTTNGVGLQPFVQQLQLSGTTALDAIASANAQSFKPSVDGVGFGAYNALISGPKTNGSGVQTAGGLVTKLDNDGSRNNDSLSVNTSVLKAIGVAPAYTGANAAIGADGSVSFSDAFSFDFDPTNGVTAGSFDFVGIAIHEIGHALGFRSGVDTYDANTGFTGNLNNFTFMTQLDLFRYSAASAALGVNDWQIGGTSYFSIDGGQTAFLNGLHSTGTRFGDGRQASHWKDAAQGATQLGIMDPTFGRQQQGIITSLDLAAFDAIGWNVAYDVIRNPGREFTTLSSTFGAVPEPANWALMIAGFGLVGGAMRRARVNKVTFATA
jgi:PEP-CTERM motif